jgi:hypothetical protein
MIDKKKIDALKKKIASIRLGSTKKHYKVSIGELCDLMLLFVEQLEALPKLNPNTSNCPESVTLIERTFEGNDTNSPPENH